jgi:hypothetical protein
MALLDTVVYVHAGLYCVYVYAGMRRRIWRLAPNSSVLVEIKKEVCGVVELDEDAYNVVQLDGDASCRTPRCPSSAGMPLAPH